MLISSCEVHSARLNISGTLRSEWGFMSRARGGLILYICMFHQFGTDENVALDTQVVWLLRNALKLLTGSVPCVLGCLLRLGCLVSTLLQCEGDLRHNQDVPLCFLVFCIHHQIKYFYSCHESPNRCFFITGDPLSFIAFLHKNSELSWGAFFI